ncbi:uncharacterized protein L3040_003823 [Drepanopeziza brunnea f. sp. 'multigermtubi']|uniref:Spindle poison sensitivity protein Scp3 n=1 Tax=Marssonina brunnea f. sp. multigermtubi (strain MB_m1) TaxID=1072389 RepID=K1WC78_MARBU|nr:spindle poison sensitivity protein Scp3 [Drepanopeziza brunnea f. sp. 'multigermtubi' MB_m1]EKD14980.1 spindle poison sensitivity protein Scp3 [Drepanopeziza brunnea f. sp. 'multigermtubi' MB_m1]KAJ5046584.1 hypothetical protein L3040_003823 [Drepanopeziza brunnea f. sp. 'multigermtubi']
MPTEYRHSSSGSLNIPPPSTIKGSGGPPPPVGGMGRFEGPRSPPSRQNTSHVPCKFFRQGTCQAGAACPFSHDLASQNDNICKYFAKGNCKFGPKCANVHVLPDGRRVNYKHGGSMGGGHLNIGNRLNTDGYHNQPSTSTLSNFIRNAAPSPYSQPYPVAYPNQENGFPLVGRQQSIDINVPTIDTSYAPRPISNYGSPRDDDHSRYGLGLSPVAGKGLSVLDAQLPASFDSNGVSWIARNGPIASSVPAKFGLESPPSSLGAAKDGRTSEALKSLHSSAFGDDTRDRFNGTPSSPPTYPVEEYFGKKPMHSQRYAKPKVMSSSLPKPDYDWDPSFQFEEDYLPEALNDLMTPQEKARRGSRTAAEEGRPIINCGTATPNNEVKFGSPSGASPSRWGSLFSRHQKEDEDRARPSVFGHVGSPLRNSSLHPGASPSSRPIARPTVSGDSSPYLASPPRQSSMSIISQQLQRTRLSRAESNGSSEFPNRVPSNPISGARAVAERQVSSSSMSNRFTTPIDEEQGDFMFNLEDDVDERKREKRNSGGWNIAHGKSPQLGPIGPNGASGSSNGGVEGVFGAH